MLNRNYRVNILRDFRNELADYLLDHVNSDCVSYTDLIKPKHDAYVEGYYKALHRLFTFSILNIQNDESLFDVESSTEESGS
jgi:hypothetical protein